MIPGRANKHEIISVVIPTFNRPDLLLRAVKSALAQSMKEISVIVVIDGPDDATLRALEQVKDNRVRILSLPENVGPSDARNAGVRAANSEWIAFLDDDDEWLPDKLYKQIKAASRFDNPFPIVASSVIGQTPTGNYIWPRKMPKLTEPISEYLFAKKSIFSSGESLLLTSTLLMKKELLEKVPFHSGLKKHEDWELLLRAARLDGVSFEIVPEPLVIWYTEERRTSLGSNNMWTMSLEWIRENRDLVTPRAYAGFIATQVAAQASSQQVWKAFMPLLCEMYRIGAPRIIDLLLYLKIWFIPQETRRRIRSFWRHGSATRL